MARAAGGGGEPGAGEAELEAEEAKLCAESLQCYALLTTFEEDTMGFGVSLSFRGEVIVNARSPFEFLSYEAFMGPGAADEEEDEDDEEDEEEQDDEGGRWECAICTFINLDRVALACRICGAARPAESGQDHRRGRAVTACVRKNACGTEHFTHFLPLYLTERHFRRELTAQCLQAAWCRVRAESVPAAPDPEKVNEAIWHVLPALMNSTVVALVGGDLHASDVALRGYYNLHRLLLAMATPELRKRAEAEAGRFASDPESRLKACCPNLGHFLPRLLLLSDPLAAWSAICEGLLQEAIDRTVLHAYRDFPSMGEEDGEAYAKMRWESASKGLRMLLFSVRFVRHVAQWGPPEQIAAHYDKRFGQASRAEQEAFRREVCYVKAVDSWEAFSRCWRAEEADAPGAGAREAAEDSEGAMPLSLRLGGLGAEELQAALRGSEESSLHKGYHSKPQPMPERAARRAAKAGAPTP